MKHIFSRTAAFLTAAITISGGYLIGTMGESMAQTLLEETGTIEPAMQEYPLEMEAGDAVTITMTSEDFDTVLTLVGPTGEEVAFNDDFAGTLNSQIVYNADASGSYVVVAESFDGEGGDFDISVRPATAYEIAYSEAQTSIQAGDFAGAIALYSEAIELEPDNPEPYLGRADAYFGQAQADLEAQGNFLEEPSDLPEDTREAIVDDFQRAADIYEAEGDPFAAESLREQIQYIETGEFPGPDSGTR
ncbi:tetratricopeptide repeat protein [Oscillatoria sp. CS-180]|uniref:tetratricopeptide repeat protein n=1 Tax=Oscillatoria sp. CS-180 TaxID=3021720 RepID=UPI00232E46E6|nr:tetratricopeptide repeat protein [Oscillatoria sp. CS-180]MDB9524871.1 tetratricopeptide repeat protein [Oscillatoria sp. CS-180]